MLNQTYNPFAAPAVPIQGSNPQLQVTAPVQQVAPPAPVTPAPAAPRPAARPVAPRAPAPAIPPIDLSGRFANVGGTIYDKTTGQAFSSPEQFYAASGQRSLDNLRFDTAWQPSQVPGVPELPPTPSSAPAFPLSPEQQLADAAGRSGLSYDDYTKIVQANSGLTPEEKQAIQDRYGIGTLEDSVFTPPSKTSEQLYKDAYGMAGLAALKTQIAEKLKTLTDEQARINEGIAAVNENPWLSESARIGRAGRLRDQAEARLANLRGEVQSLQDLYNQGLKEVEGVVSRQTSDFDQNQKLNAQKLQYLQAKAEQDIQNAQAAKTSKAARYGDYFTAKAGATKPETVTTEDGTVLRWNPVVGKFDVIYQGQGLKNLPASAQEYKFAVANGYKGTYEQYQNEDANRKRPVTNVSIGGGVGGLNSKEATLFNSIVDKYNKSPLIAAADRAVILKNTIQQVRANPGNGAQQLNLAYAYIQALDTYQSAVREGELNLVNSIDSKVGKLSNYVQQMSNGQIVRPEVAKQIADAAENILNTIYQAAQSKAKAFESQADTVGLGDAWKQYTGGFTPSYQGTPGGAATDPLGIR